MPPLDDIQLHKTLSAAASLSAAAAVPQACLAPGAGAPLASSPAPLDALFRGVAHAFAEERVKGFPISSTLQDPASLARIDGAVRAAVQSYVAAGHDDWTGLARFCDEHYVRHLIDESPDCEMMLICWKQGQGSRIHNHADSHCWLSVLAGGVEELRYTSGGAQAAAGEQPTLAPRLPGVIASTTPCPQLTPAGVGKVGVGATAYINDGLGLHAVRCDDGACGAQPGAVSLHIYAPPIRRVRLYEPEADRVTLRTPGFHTIRGREEEVLQDLSLLSSSL